MTDSKEPFALPDSPSHNQRVSIGRASPDTIISVYRLLKGTDALPSRGQMRNELRAAGFTHVVVKPDGPGELIDARIPCLKTETLDTLEVKVPSFWAYLLGDQVIPPSVDPEKKKLRGRPRKYGPVRQGRTVHKIENDKTTHKLLPHRVRQSVIDDFSITLVDLSPFDRCERISEKYNLSYDQVHALTRNLSE